MGKNKIELYEKPKLVEDVLLVEGITRSGKFLLCNILNAIADVEHPRYCGLLENLAFMARLKLVDRGVAMAVIQNTIDNLGYDNMIGRDINSRYDDKTSIYKSPKIDEYLERGSGPDGDAAVKKIKARKRYFTHIVHEVFPNIDMFFDLYPKIRIIRIDRDPVDLAYSWYQRGWGKRWGTDPKSFTIALKGPKKPVPWFAYPQAKDYEKSSEIDRVITSLYSLNNMSREAYESLTADTKKKVHFVTYEDLIVNTDEETKKISTFLKKKIMPGMEDIKRREKLPSADPKMSRDKKIDFIRTKATPGCFSLMMQMEKEYSGSSI